LKVWEKAHELDVGVLSKHGALSKNNRAVRSGLADSTSAAVSAGEYRRSDVGGAETSEFTGFLQIAMGSASER